TSSPVESRKVSCERSSTIIPECSSASAIAARARSTPARSSSPLKTTVVDSASAATVTENGGAPRSMSGPYPHAGCPWGELAPAGDRLERAARLGGCRVGHDPPELVLVDQDDPVVALGHLVPRKRPLALEAVDQHHVVADLEAVLGRHLRVVEVVVDRLEV